MRGRRLKMFQIPSTSSATAPVNIGLSTPLTAPVKKPRKKRDTSHISTKIRISAKKTKKKKLDELKEAPVEDQLILRLPPSPETEEFRNLVKKRQIPSGFYLNFSESRKATVCLGLGDSAPLKAKLVDLPCILESQKTFDNKQFYKIGDISQMLIVSNPKYPHPPATPTTDKINYPDGLTPPMRAVRIKRFRKRVSKKVIEDVEKEVERLLQADLEAEDVKFEITEQKELDLEEEFSNADETEERTENIEDDDFAAEIEEALYADAAESSEEESEEDEEDSQEEEAGDEEEDDDGVDGQLREHIALLKEEISDIMRKIDEKKTLIISQVNPIIKKRFEDIIIRLETELDLKKEQLEMANLEIQDQGEDVNQE